MMSHSQYCEKARIQNPQISLTVAANGASPTAADGKGGAARPTELLHASKDASRHKSQRMLRLLLNLCHPIQFSFTMSPSHGTTLRAKCSAFSSLPSSPSVLQSCLLSTGRTWVRQLVALLSYESRNKTANNTAKYQRIQRFKCKEFKQIQANQSSFWHGSTCRIEIQQCWPLPGSESKAKSSLSDATGAVARAAASHVALEPVHWNVCSGDPRSKQQLTLIAYRCKQTMKDMKNVSPPQLFLETYRQFCKQNLPGKCCKCHIPFAGICLLGGLSKPERHDPIQACPMCGSTESVVYSCSFHTMTDLHWPTLSVFIIHQIGLKHAKTICNNLLVSSCWRTRSAHWATALVFSAASVHFGFAIHVDNLYLWCLRFHQSGTVGCESWWICKAQSST